MSDQGRTKGSERGIDLREKGGPRGGVPQTSDRRLYMELFVFGDAGDPMPVARAIEGAGLEGVLYADAHDPRGLALLVLGEDPDTLVAGVRDLAQKPSLAGLRLKPEYTMLGRTYGSGFEPDLEDWLFHRPRRVVLGADARWAVWYPLRRSGAFNALSHEEQVVILREHGRIGHAFAEAGQVQDIRLACFGLDRDDNDFVIGLLGPDLHPLSACVQGMRGTRQTSQFIQQMGPFFVGRTLWQSPLPG